MTCGRVYYGVACPKPRGHRGGCLWHHDRLSRSATLARFRFKWALRA